MEYCKNKFLKELLKRIDKITDIAENEDYINTINNLNSIISKIQNLFVDDLNANFIFQETLKSYEKLRNHKITFIIDYAYTLGVKLTLNNVCGKYNIEFNKYIEKMDELTNYKNDTYIHLNELYLNDLSNFQDELLKHLDDNKVFVLLDTYVNLLEQQEFYQDLYIFALSYTEGIKCVERTDDIKLLEEV